MKLNRACSALSAVILLVFICSQGMLTASAVNTGFESMPMPEDEKASFINSIDLLPLYEEPPKEAITCFDVSPGHLIAIGLTSDTTRRTVAVYSDTGVFQYGYTFNCYGSLNVEWDGENLNVYFVRGNSLMSVTPSGEIVDVLDVPYTAANNDYLHRSLGTNKRTVGGTEYLLEKGSSLFAGAYAKLTVKDSTGDERAIYDVTSMQLAKTIATVVIVCVVALFIIGTTPRLFKKIKQAK